MNRGVRLLAVTTLATTLAGCSVVDAFGPSANDKVLTLAQLAEADAEAWSGEGSGDGSGEVSALRAHHAEDLFAEIARLCGTDADGRVPDSCGYEHADPEVTAHEDPSGSLAEYVELIPEAPAESRDLLTAQAVDLAALVDTVPEAPEMTTEDAEVARDLLRREFGAVYALDLAQAYADADSTSGLEGLLRAHEERISALEETLAPTGEVPVPEAGYAFTDLATPTDPASALTFAADVEYSLTQAWAQAATDVDASSLGWFLALAGDAIRAVDASPLAGTP